MPVDQIYREAEEKMQKAGEILRDEFRHIRTGRASPALVENIKIDYHGTITPIKHLATITTPDAQLILIKPYDPSVMSNMEKAILQSELGITPNNDGKAIRLPVPPLNEERRKKIVQQLKVMAEDAKIALRNIRRDANKHIDTEEKDSIITEDEAEKAKDKILKLVHEHEKRLNEVLSKKIEETLKI